MALYSSTGELLFSDDVPLQAGNNGVATMDLGNTPGVSQVKVCMCDGAGALTQLSYSYPGSGKKLDSCGECGGSNTRCKQLHESTVQLKHSTSSNPITVEQIGTGHSAMYKLCYLHESTPSDKPGFEQVAVRVGFESRKLCTMRSAGTCDSSLNVPAEAGGAYYCDMFSGPRSQINSRLWTYEDVARGYRMCTTMSLAELTQCKDSNGATVLHTEDATDSGIVYHGALYATELSPVNCFDELACERVLHSTMQRFSIYTSINGRGASVRFSSGDVDFSSRVSSISCVHASGDLRVILQTRATDESGRLMRLEQAEVLDSHIRNAPDTLEFSVQSLQGHDCDSANGCEQVWSIGTLGAGMQEFVGELRLGFSAHNRDDDASMVSVVYVMLIMNSQCGSVPGGNEEEEEERASVVAKGIAVGHIELFKDRQFLQPYAGNGPSVQSFVDGESIYARLAVDTIEEVLNHAHAPDLRVDSVYLCYSPTRSIYHHFDVEQPYSTGCLSPGQWITTELVDSGRITHDGKMLSYEEFSYDENTLHTGFVFRGHASTDAPVYVDARWHLHWGATEQRHVSAEALATVRIAEHRRNARMQGKINDMNWGETATSFHLVLGPSLMHQTSKLHRTHAREKARLTAARGVAISVGMSMQELQRALSGHLNLETAMSGVDDALIRTRSGEVYPAFNDESWNDGAESNFYSSCPQTHYISANSLTLTEGTCRRCSHPGRCPSPPGLFHPACIDNSCNKDWDDCPWEGCHNNFCNDCDDDFDDWWWWPVIVFWVFVLGLFCLLIFWLWCPGWGCPTFFPDDGCHYLDDGHHEHPEMCTPPRHKRIDATAVAIRRKHTRVRVSAVQVGSPSPAVQQSHVTAGALRNRSRSPGGQGNVVESLYIPRGRF